MNSFLRPQKQENPKLRQLRMRIDVEDALYPCLKKLKIKGKDLDDLPNTIFQLKELQVLDLSPEREACIDFHMADLPPSIGNLVNLRVLMLDTNSLSYLPTEICLLENLQQLSLSNNFVKELPKEMEKLANLTSVHLSNNLFKVFPEALTSMPQMSYIDLSCNSLTSIPPSISSLQQLHTLLLCNNNLKSLPEEIGQLTKLSTLWIGNNKLKSLPPSIGNLEKLDWGDIWCPSSVLEGNLLIKPPIDVCMQGSSAIREFFKKE